LLCVTDIDASYPNVRVYRHPDATGDVIMSARFLAVFASLAVAGCAGTNITPGPFAANQAGNFTPLVAMHQAAPALRIKPDAGSYKRALYIVDFASNKPIKILTNTYYHELGSIPDGGRPIADSIDQHGNLYVANNGAQNVTEYVPGDTSPSFTYDVNMHTPIAVTVDRLGNVYEVDFNSSYPLVNEYFQGVNQVTQSCSAPGIFADGITVDTSGDVFLATRDGIYEYIGGLSGCSATLVNSSIVNAGGMAMDANSNLIVCNQYSAYYGSVEVLDPPYSSVSRTIGPVFGDPYSVSLNKKNKLVYVGDVIYDTITVINYQTGQSVKVLNGATYGISTVVGVVDAPNAVY
jgi:hypothetical protein